MTREPEDAISLHPLRGKKSKVRFLFFLSDLYSIRKECPSFTYENKVWLGSLQEI